MQFFDRIHQKTRSCGRHVRVDRETRSISATKWRQLSEKYTCSVDKLTIKKYVLEHSEYEPLFLLCFQFFVTSARQKIKHGEGNHARVLVPFV